MAMEIEILWENQDILVINKPAGMVVNRAESVGGETVQDWADTKIRRYEDTNLGEDERLFKKRSGIAHRLDKETSGCLLIAKNPTALINLLGQFKERVVKKEYLALVHGRISPASGTIRLPLHRSRFDREKWEIHYGGKVAQTSWKVEKYYGKFTLVRLFPLTGRTHQIRVHLSHLGYPIFADEKYLSKNLRNEDRKRLSHHFLHAEKIGFADLSGS
ncbi:RNA pseudouridine synthase, partial [Candidatus Collierbacteria bacterium]|nr:RNA pseudouridine synthase [Candidatus Collierbacteria bacterium]